MVAPQDPAGARVPRPGLIAVVFLLLSVPYSLISDRLLLALVADPVALTAWQTGKGWAYVVAAAGLGGAMAVVRSHHERWDGGGYPDGLAGAAIPLLARIFDVVDEFLALLAGGETDM